MRDEEDEPNWFARWEDELPRPEELMPLSQSLITPDLALAFDIPTLNPSPSSGLHNHVTTAGHHLAPTDIDSPDNSAPTAAGSGGGGSGGDEPARTLKRPRLVWTPQLHKRFVDSVAHLGIKNAVPKTIMQLMNVDGLTRENVASHLQKYRLYLKRMQGLSASGGGACTPGPLSAADAATEQLFASNPIPHPFLSRSASGPGQETFLPFMSPPLLQHHQQIAAAAAAAQQQYYHQRQMAHFGSPTANSGVYDNGFHSRGSATQGLHRMGTSGLGMIHPSPIAAPQNSYGDDVDSGGGGGMRVLTLFPTGTED